MAIEATPQTPPENTRNSRRGEWAELVDTVLKPNEGVWYYVGIHSSGNATYLRNHYGLEVRQQMVTAPKEVKLYGQFRARVWVMWPGETE
jgi:hypothetical protein